MTMIPAWLKILNFMYDTDDKEIGSVVKIVKGCDISTASAYRNIKILESMGLINTRRENRVKVIILTQKFFTSRKTYKELYEGMS